MKLLILLCVTLCAVHTFAYKTGAPDAACKELEPKHKNWKGQPTPSPYKIEAKKANGVVGVQIKITDKTVAEKFKGFLLVARDASNKNVGSWEKTDKAKLLKCEKENDAITHELNEEKETIKLKWKMPADFSGTICFKGAVVKNGTTFWTGLKSNVVEI